MQTSETIIEILDRLTEDKTLQRLYKCGLISKNTLLAREMYYKVEAEIASGAQRKVAAQYVADMMGMSVQHVYRCIKKVKQ